jgi:hypothetical protein
MARGRMLGTAALALAAIVVIGWLAVMERNTRLRAASFAAARKGDVARAEDDLRRSRLLSPDTTPDLSRALLYFGQGRRADATGLLERVIRSEPKNLPAWGELLVVSRGHDAALTSRALAAIRRLDPLEAPRR